MGLPLGTKLEDLPSWRANIVIAIEDPMTRDQIESVLGRDGHRVHVVVDGVELLERLSDLETQGAIHLAIADLELSGFTGLEILGLTDGIANRPPVLLLGGSVDLALRRAASRFGAAAMLGRPFDLDELRLLVGTLLRPAYRAQSLRAA